MRTDPAQRSESPGDDFDQGADDFEQGWDAAARYGGDVTTPPAQRARSFRHMFGSAVLATQLFVIGFAGLVAYGLQLAPPSVIWPVMGFGVALCLAALTLMRGMVGRILGYVVQALTLASGLLIAMMWILGAVFTVLWVIAMVLGGKIDREKATFAEAQAQHRI